MKIKQCIDLIETDQMTNLHIDLYGEQSDQQKRRYVDLINQMNQAYAEEDVQLFSTPGRTELGGNHTDHNHGRVLAASIHLDSLAVVTKNEDNLVKLNSDGFSEAIVVDLSDLNSKLGEQGKTESLVRGLAFKLREQGYEIGGFHGFLSSMVPVGGGLSSSASIEILLATIFNYLYNQGQINPIQLAQMAQFAENVYFGKPCGLMDQMACAYGGIIGIDFSDPSFPKTEQLNVNFQQEGYSLFVVDTGGNHADLTQDYAAIPKEMKLVANALDKSFCRETSITEFLNALPDIRSEVGDRALLRCWHFLNDNERVADQIALLKEGNFKQYLQLVNDSGNSSWKMLQNCYTSKNPTQQGIPLALAVTEFFLKGDGGYRVHGGGFEGTIQAYIPNAKAQEYLRFMERIFGQNSVLELKIRQKGTLKIL